MQTTFLNVLAGIHNAKAVVGGSISVNGQVMTGDKIRRISGFVHQVRPSVCSCARCPPPDFRGNTLMPTRHGAVATR